MSLTYRKIDADFLAKLPANIKSDIESYNNRMLGKPFPSGEKVIVTYCTYCPYCKKATMGGFPDEREPTFCMFCGETDTYIKVTRSLSKAKDLLILSNNTIIDVNLKRILHEQIIIIIATSMEIFLRDIYATLLNIRYIKSNLSLYERFYRDSKNDFATFGKAKKELQNELNINFNTFLSDDEIDNLNILSLKRNVIVHNAGIIDNPYISQSGQKDLAIGRQLPIIESEINLYIDAIEKLSNGLFDILKKEHEDELIKKFEIILVK
ncbi:hypothetical protein [Methanocella arvoryzae]|nr:hypothetical protein [Methanocella arvoryzae]